MHDESDPCMTETMGGERRQEKRARGHTADGRRDRPLTQPHLSGREGGQPELRDKRQCEKHTLSLRAVGLAHTQPSFFSALLSPCSHLVRNKGLCSALDARTLSRLPKGAICLSGGFIKRRGG